MNTAAEQIARPYNGQYPYFKFVDDYGNLDSSNYNGLQAVLTARNYHGLTLTGGYTFSHALSENSGQGTAGSNSLPINSYGNLHAQLYGPSTFDIRHKFTLSGTYTVPGRKGFGQMLEGWSLNGSAVVQTGAPWHTADSTTDFAGTGEQTGNSSGNEGGQWDFFGNPSDFKPVNNYYGVTPGPTGVPGIPYFPGNCASANPAKGSPCNTAIAPTANAMCNQKAAATGTACHGIARCAWLLCSWQLRSGSPALRRLRITQYNQWYDNGFRNVDFSVTKAFKIRENFRLNSVLSSSTSSIGSTS